MTRSTRVFLTLAVTFAALAGATNSTQAATFSFQPCGSIGSGWTIPANQAFLLHSDCGGTWFQELQIPTIDPTPSVTTFQLGPAPITAVQVVAKGRDRTSEGVEAIFAVCRGENYPADCGTPVHGPADAPYNPIFTELTLANGGVPEGADRLMMRAVCTRNELPDYCSGTTDEARFENVIVSAVDDAPPVLSNFATTSGWVNTPPSYSLTASDEASGIDYVSASQYGSVTTQNFCEGPDAAWGCPLWAYADLDTGLLQNFTGKNTITVSVGDRANHVTSRTVSYMLDKTKPAKPADLSIGAHEGWILGDHATLTWTNGGETVPTSYSSGIASATVTVLPVYGGSAPETTTYHGEAISTAPIDLPRADKWTVNVTVTDAAGNVSDEGSLTFDNESTGPAGPYLSPFPAIGLTQADSGVTLRWNPVANPRSGICGYRGWIGRGTVPNLAADPKSLIADVNARWALSATGLRTLTDGENTVAIAAVDCAGVVSSTSETTVTIDRVPPSATLTPDSTWFASGTGPRLEGLDPGKAEEASGVASIWYRIGNGPKVSVSADSTDIPLDEGVSSIRYGVVDEAGNETAYPARSIGVDSVAPEAAISPVDGDPGAFRASVNDGLSGVVDAWCEYRHAGGGAWTRVGDRFVSADGTTDSVGLNLRLLDDELPTGDYELRVVARDAAGNTLSALARTVHLPFRPPSDLTAGIATLKYPKAKSHAVTVNLGQRARLSGWLRDAHGQPIAGAQLRVVASRSDGGRRVLATLRTTASGLYSLALGTDVSRSLQVHFDGDHENGPASAGVSESVRAKITLKLSHGTTRRGRPLSAKGRITLLSASVPSRGIPIELRLCTKRRCSRANISGRSDSEGGYRIAIPTNVHRRTRYRVRAVVRGVPGWPFADGRSKTATVVIR